MSTGTWWRLTLHCPVEATDRLAVALVEATGHGVEEAAPGELRSMAESEAAAQHLLARLVASEPGVSGEVTPLEPIDWTVRWRDGIETRRMGRLTITTSWLPVTPAPNEVVVTIDPESAFGNGEHGSTRVALALLEQSLRSGDLVLDVGSGSGILAIAAVALGAQRAVAIEVDAETEPIAEANAVRNGVADRVRFLTGDAEILAPMAGPATLICSNILRTVNTRLLPALAAALAPGGQVIFSGMEQDEAELFRDALQEAGWGIRAEHADAGWWGVVAGPT